jgi:hypothetical protein
MRTIHSSSSSLHTVGLAACVMFAVSACAGGPAAPDDPLASDHPLWMVPINHTDRGAVNMAVDRYGMGGAYPHGGGGARACCYPGPTDCSKPVTVHWEWDTVVALGTKVVPPTEPHSMLVHFPPGGPAKDDRYLCLILRERETAELAFSRVASHCPTK